MNTCKNCGGTIRWTETLGWVHGPLGSGYPVQCEKIGPPTVAEPVEDFI